MNPAKNALLLIALCFLAAATTAKEIKQITSPNKKLSATFHQETIGDSTAFYLSIQAREGKAASLLIPRIDLGIERAGIPFSKHTTLLRHSARKRISERYTALHGKRKERSNQTHEMTFYWADPQGNKLNLVLRVYNDGVCFRYQIPDSSAAPVRITREKTTYTLPPSANRWLQHFVTSYEGPFLPQQEEIKQGEWGYPALFCANEKWMLLTEADIDRNYCATKFHNLSDKHRYELSFPAPTDGNGTGDIIPSTPLPWASPWRVIIAGELKDIVESTLVEDVSAPCRMQDTDWILPGRAAWIYWAYNHGTRDFRKVCEYIDLAAEMGWEYMLIDWEWDIMENGGKLEDAVRYAREKGIKPLMWYNSGGKHNRVGSTPRDRLISAEARAKEMAWLKEIGVYGIKVDFFESDKQDMMNYYIDLLEDAARYKLLINFHGCTIPRGWSRTYPHLMTMEAIYGAEQYNNGGNMTLHGAEWNTVFPFTRNVVGPMDYTPVAFTDSQHPHTTTHAHELALATLFESGIQHWADRPEGFRQLPPHAREYMRHIPTDWDDTRFIAGYPGDHIILARRKGDTWYIAGINGTDHPKTFTFPTDFLPAKSYHCTLLQDGTEARTLKTEVRTYKKSETLRIDCLPRGGFAVVLRP